jgi:hypothetical protein
MSIPPEALIDNLNSHVEAANGLKASEYELTSHYKDGYDKIEVEIDNIIGVEPGPEQGTFIMRLGHEIVENRGKIMVITGASLIAIAGFIIQRKRSNKNSE